LIEINVNKKYFSLPLSIQGNTTNVKIKWWFFSLCHIDIKKN
jgi:hypothetical protein